MSGSECLSSRELNGLLQNRFGMVERDRVEAHLAGCRVCRHKLAVLYENAEEDHGILTAPPGLKARARRIPHKDARPVPPWFLNARHYATTWMTAAGAVVLSISCLLFLNPVQRMSAPPTLQIAHLSEAARLESAVEPQAPADDSAIKTESSGPTRARAEAAPPEARKSSRGTIRDTSSLSSARHLPDAEKAKVTQPPQAPSSADSASAGSRKDSPTVPSVLGAAAENPSTANAAAPPATEVATANSSVAASKETGQPPRPEQDLPALALAEKKEQLRQTAGDARRSAIASAAVSGQAAAREPGITAGPKSASIPLLQLQAPPAGATVTADRVEFRWAPVSPRRRYAFTLADEKGAVIFKTPTGQNNLKISVSSLRVESAKPYFWFVEVVLPNGQTFASQKSLIIFRTDSHR